MALPRITKLDLSNNDINVHEKLQRIAWLLICATIFKKEAEMS